MFGLVERRSAGRFLIHEDPPSDNIIRRTHHVRTTRRSTKFAALAVGLSLIVAACGSDDDEASDTTAGQTATSAAGTTPASEAPDTTAEAVDTTAEAPDTTAEAPDTTAEAPDTTGEAPDTTGGEEPSGEPALRITYDIADTAVWSDGSPITWADFECTALANTNTPGSLTTAGYEDIISVTQGESEKQAIVEMATTYAAYKTLFFNLAKADEYEDCNDLSESFEAPIPYSGREWLMDSWSAEQIVMVPNPEYQGDRVPQAERIVIVPAEDGTTLLKAGTVDFIFPQAYTGIDEELADPNVEFSAANGGSYEGLYFQQQEGPFADPVYRAAFAMSIDRDALYEQIYAPFAQGTPLLDCGPLAPGPYCDDVFAETYDPEGAVALLEGEGWTKNADGLWESPDGEVPEVRWMVNTGNTRRESTQEYLIPLLAEAGFSVAADNCEALPCVFETRLPSLDYDLAMYISTVSPDPSVLRIYGCDQIPSEDNDFQGQNNVGWCNEEATDLLIQADVTIDEAERTELVKQAIQLMRDDFIMLPTLQFPNIGAFRTDRTGNTNAELANYRAINDWYQWEDVDGDGTIVLGAEQFPTPDCPNPFTECANSSWFVWMTAFPVMPGVYETTADQTYELSEFMASEPVVEVL